MSEFEKKARLMLEKAQLADLLDEWELTSGRRGCEVATVRGWILDELERRNPEAFNAWLDGEALDEELRAYMTEKAYIS